MVLDSLANYMQKIGRVEENKRGSAVKRPTSLELHGWMWTVSVEDRNSKLRRPRETTKVIVRLVKSYGGCRRTL